MKQEHYFPVFIILANLAAAAVYFLSGDKMRAGYFFSGAAITFFATF